MNPTRLIAIGAIVACTTFAWFILGNALSSRTEDTDSRLFEEVQGNWGSSLDQLHPSIYYLSPTSVQSRRNIQPSSSQVKVKLTYDPKQKGLLWYRTYRADFEAEYLVENPTPITQTIYVSFDFPSQGARFDRFTLAIGEKNTSKVPRNGRITDAVILEPGATVPIVVTYATMGLNDWRYSFGENPRVQNFELEMETNFAEFNIPAGSESPSGEDRERTADGWLLKWKYSDVIGARAIGMDMPAVVNPGPVATRITFFAPISLLFFFAVLVILSTVKGINLHPVNYFFLAAGLFAFQLLFAYLVDLLPVMTAFGIAAATSLFLVTTYLWRVAGGKFARLSALAQLFFMILFSYSFFFQGLTGITITAGAIITLALLMSLTAKIDWEKILKTEPKTQPLPPDPSSPPAIPPQTG